MGLDQRSTMKVLLLTLAAIGTGMAGKGGDMMEMMGKPSKEKEGLCLSQDEVHMICGMGTGLQRKMDAALKQCMPMEMMAATVDDMQMQALSMSPDTKLLSSGRAFDFEEPSERRRRPKKPSKKPSKTPSKKPSKKPFTSCEVSCPSIDEMKASAMKEMETELCALNAIGWIDDAGNMMQDVEDADMAEFPAAVREAVKEAKIKDCAEVATAKKLEAMMEDKEFQKKYGACFTNQCYSEKEMAAMTEMMEMMAGMQCWDKAFTKACTGHIKENLMSMASNMLAGR